MARLAEPERRSTSPDDAGYFQVATADSEGFVNDLPDQVTLDEAQRAPDLLPAIKPATELTKLTLPGRLSRPLYACAGTRPSMTLLHILISAD